MHVELFSINQTEEVARKKSYIKTTNKYILKRIFSVIIHNNIDIEMIFKNWSLLSVFLIITLLVDIIHSENSTTIASTEITTAATGITTVATATATGTGTTATTATTANGTRTTISTTKTQTSTNLAPNLLSINIGQ